MQAATILLIAFSLAFTGCSLAAKGSRPDSAVENVHCALEYQPSANGPSANGPPAGGGHDLLFLAWSYPYRGETFYQSPPDVFFHALFAPGRHLTADARVEGARCERIWGKGFRLPSRPSERRWLLCTRQGLEPVLFEVETTWGTCSERIPRGDVTPRVLDALRSVKKLPELGAD